MDDFTHCSLVSFQIGNDKPGTTFNIFYYYYLWNRLYQNQSVLKLDHIQIKVTQKYHEHRQTQDFLGEAVARLKIFLGKLQILASWK